VIHESITSANPNHESVESLVLFGGSVVAGAMNTVAGGGTLLTFPTLIWLGMPSVMANATNTVAIWPGSLGSVWGYRRELSGVDRRVYALVVPSVIGGIAGAILLRVTPTQVFDRLVPILVLFATVVFLVQEWFQRLFNRSSTEEHEGPKWVAEAMLFQLAVAVYGGYFGAGIGILMLAALGIMGHTNIHQMIAVKNLLAVCINGVAAVYFVFSGLVSWPHVIVMAVGAIAGGVGSARVARRLNQETVRRMVIVLGFGMAVSLMFRL
jgi:uncharacterized protein